jgi:hypothetical protein
MQEETQNNCLNANEKINSHKNIKKKYEFAHLFSMIFQQNKLSFVFFVFYSGKCSFWKKQQLI